MRVTVAQLFVLAMLISAASIMSLQLPCAAADGSGSYPQPSLGDWVISEDTYVGNESITVTGTVHLSGGNLTLWNVELRSPLVLVEDGLSLTIGGGSIFRSTPIRLEGNNTISISDSKFVNGTGVLAWTSSIEVQGCEFKVTAQTFTLYDCETRITDTVFYETGSTALYVQEGAGTEIANCSIIGGNVDGPMALKEPVYLAMASNVVIDGLEVHRSKLSAITSFGSEIEIYDSLFAGCGDGIVAEGSEFDIENLTVRDSWPQEYRCNGCSASSTGMGLYIGNSTLSATDLILENNTNNMVLLNTEARIENADISSSSTDGILMYEGSLVLCDSILSGNGGYGVHMFYSDDLTESGNNFTGNEAAICQEWHLTITVTDAYGDGIPQVPINCRPEIGRKVKGATDDNGTAVMDLIEYVLLEDGTMENYVPYLINVSKDASNETSAKLFVDERNLTVDRNIDLQIQFQIRKAELSVLNITFDGRLKEDLPVEVIVRIANTGEAFAPECKIRVSCKSEEGRENIFDEKWDVPMGAEIEVRFFWTPKGFGDFNVTVQLDSPKKIMEFNETNNDLYIHVDVEEGDDYTLFGYLLLGVLAALGAVLIILAIMVAKGSKPPRSSGDVGPHQENVASGSGDVPPGDKGPVSEQEKLDEQHSPNDQEEHPPSDPQ